MAGTVQGGLKAAAKNTKDDPDFYRRIGAKGGRNGNTGGFYANRELARIAGKKGGRKSRRGKNKQQPSKEWDDITNKYKEDSISHQN